ncbi:MAG: hypothetical protein RMJ43_13305, partial [Chloroherpetonaceae bacterium]|nr:hypothetical protein [Chloroherpetonaceae bacterium]
PPVGALPASPAHGFATTFFGGGAVSTQISTAPPSSGDGAAAEAFLAGIARARGGLREGSEQPEAWGKAFGKWVRQQERDNPRAFRSLVHAIRVHGDDYLRALQERSREERARARKAHQARYQEAYLNYLQAREEAIRTEEPEAYARFEREEEALRRRFRTGVFKGSRLGQTILDNCARREERLNRFRAFFQQEGLPTVLSFWEWDRQLNPHPFERVPEDGKGA